MVFQFGFSTTVVKDSGTLMHLQLLYEVKENSIKNNAEATVAVQLNQGTMKGTGCFVPFLNFLWILSFFQEKESDKKMSEQKVLVKTSNRRKKLFVKKINKWGVIGWLLV